MAATQESATSAVVLGTRKSQLAIAQVDMVIEALNKLHGDSDLSFTMQIVSTMADKNQTKSFQDFANTKSIWTEELEELLVQKKLDVVVHSLKDMPTTLPPSCALGFITPRADPRDVVAMPPSSTHRTLASLPPGSVVGTSSVRRKSQIRRHYPHLKCEDVRGNVNTRLRKLDDPEGPYSCLILAAAGLLRIGLEDRITQYLDEGMLYAPGQGALGLEIREGDERMEKILKGVECISSTIRCTAERSLLKTLEGGCSVPVAVRTDWEEGTGMLKMTGAVISIDGKRSVQLDKEGVVKSKEEADAFGRELAERMVEQGAQKILLEIRSDDKRN